VKYALLIYEEEIKAPEPGSPEGAALYGAYMEYTAAINEEGINKGGEALNSVDTATTVQVRNDEVLATDGPFAETKEQLGGFYLVECDDLDQAIAAAARIPSAKTGSIEVRPVWEF
jgi:hypothetical protein